jgi:8-amino-7-oxononanoate synthase
MATLGKAIGSYGAYISASSHIIEYLLNRAKPIIYSTAPSVFDIALAYEGYLYIEQNRDYFKSKRDELIEYAKKLFNKELNSLILKIDIGDNNKVLKIQEQLKKHSIMIGAIREPTVKSAILRVILRVGVEKEYYKKLNSFF